MPCGEASFADNSALDNLVTTSDAIVHFAGIRRGTDEDVPKGNAAITYRLGACTAMDAHDAIHRVPRSISNEWSESPLKGGLQ